MKKIMIALGVIVLLLIVVLSLVASQAGSIIKTAVEELGPEITGTAVTVDDVSVSFLSGKAGIKNLVVANPKGFKSAQAVGVGEVQVHLDVGSLFSEKIRVYKILVDGAELTYELGQGGSNIATLQKQIERSTADGGAGESAEAPSEETDILLQIDDVLVNATKVNVAVSLLGKQGSSLTLPDIHLEDIGADEGNGSSAADAMKEIFAAISAAVAKGVTKNLATDEINKAVNEKVDGELKKAGDKLKGLFK